jgi:hypothetical protein
MPGVANERISDFLGNLGLSQRIHSDGNDLTECMLSPIDWNNIESILEKERIRGYDMLEEIKEIIKQAKEK